MNEAMKEITPLLEKLAAKLGTTAEHLWGVLVKQAHVEGVVGLVFITVATVAVLCWGFFIFPKLYKKYKAIQKEYGRYSDDGEGYLIAMVIGSVALGVLFLVSLGEVNNVVTCFYNPEYWALKRVLYYIGK